jgi:aspartyl-tRNA(Asn)/glutamyl-tRNA(Gln) amidotransferase subunit C
MKITETEVRHVARLAELAVTDAQARRLTGELAAIVAFVEQLNEVADDPEAHAVVVGPESVALRADVVDPIRLVHPISEIAPSMSQGFFVVPKLEGLAEG